MDQDGSVGDGYMRLDIDYILQLELIGFVDIEYERRDYK